MSRKFRPRITYSSVVATAALFLSLGGVSYAAITIPNNSVGGPQIKANAVGNSEMNNNAVGNAEMRDNSVGAPELRDNAVGPGELQGNAVGSDQLAPNSVGEREIKPGSIEFGDIAAGQVAPRLYAHVSSSGVLAEQAGVQSAGRSSKGQYFVRFNRNLRGCVAVAGVGFGFGPGVIGAGGTAQARMNLDNDATKVGVTVYRKGYTFNDVEDNDVNVIVMC